MNERISLREKNSASTSAIRQSFFNVAAYHLTIIPASINLLYMYALFSVRSPSDDSEKSIVVIFDSYHIRHEMDVALKVIFNQASNYQIRSGTEKTCREGDTGQEWTLEN